MADNIGEALRAVKEFFATFMGFQPVLRRGEMITRKQLLDRLGISPSTLTKWESDGLNAYGQGMKEKVFVTDDVFDFLRTRPSRSK